MKEKGTFTLEATLTLPIAIAALLLSAVLLDKGLRARKEEFIGFWQARHEMLERERKRVFPDSSFSGGPSWQPLPGGHRKDRQ